MAGAHAQSRTAATGGQEPARLVLRAPRVLPGPPGRCIEDGAVLIQGDTIVAVGTAVDVQLQAGPRALSLDFPGSTILPGLVDAHVHLVFNGGRDRVARLLEETDDERLLAAMAGRARRLLDCGITTVRDLGDRGGLAVRLRDAIARGELAGPRILAATVPLTVPRGHCWFLGGEVEGEAGIRRQVVRNVAAGADVIKVMASGGSITAGGAEMWEPQFGAAELRAAVDEAHRHGLPVAAHAHGTSSIRAAVEAGVDTIEHCTWLAGPGVQRPCEQTAAAIAAAGIAVCTANDADWRLQAARYGIQRAREIAGRVRWMADRGVRLITGTDAGIRPFTALPEMLSRLRSWGFTPEEIIEMATVRTAAALCLPGVGALAPGFAADALVVRGDPLDDLDAIREPLLVVARGRVHPPRPGAAS